ncbi:hypothetical protein AB0L40_24600 [Patulibacter sp. NPDC049589]|uniref:hypothetical protein n=1 Tax=Patulibacter sp. NPDC049589 TaxID=3154731 RepID=UPI00342A82A9
MDLTNALHRLRHRKLALAAAALLGAVAFVLLTFHVSGSGLERKTTRHGTAQAELLVDSQRSAMIRVNNLNGELADRAILIAQYAQSDSIRKRMAEALHRPRDSFQLVASTSGLGAPGGSSTPALSGADVQRPLPAAGAPSVVFRASGGLPVVRITGQAPTAAEAQELATAARKALTAAVGKIGTGVDDSDLEGGRGASGGDRSYPLLLRPVANAEGSTVTTTSSLGKGIGAGVGVLVGLVLLSLLVGRPPSVDDDREPGAPLVDGEEAALEAYDAFRRNGHDRELVAAGRHDADADEERDRDDDA